jgi:Mitochondrial carrier protein
MQNRGEKTENEKSLFTLPPYATTALASTISGMLSRIACHPIDTIKAYVQSQNTPNAVRVLATATSLYQEGGIRRFYRGFGIAFVGSGPASLLYFTSYEISRDYLKETQYFRSFHFLTHFLGGLIGEAVSCVLWVPIDVIKERMQSQSKNSPFYYKNTFRAFKRIIETEGITNGIYKGYSATLASFGPFSAFYFVFYEQFKHLAQLYSLSSSEIIQSSPLPLHLQIATASIAGAIASFITSPLDLVKFRLQIQRASLANSKESIFNYTGVLNGLRQIVGVEGVKGLFRGAGTRMAFHVPSTAISLTLFEQSKSFVQLLGVQ